MHGNNKGEEEEGEDIRIILIEYYEIQKKGLLVPKFIIKIMTSHIS